MKFLIYLLLLLAVAISAWKMFRSKIRNFAVYYGADTSVESFTNYDLIVLARTTRLPVKAMARKSKVAAYLSLGEAEPYAPYFQTRKGASWVLKENPVWGSHVLDPRAPEWREILLDLVKQATSDGFNAFFLDTLDVVIELEKKEPVKFKGAIDATVSTIQALQNNFPGCIWIANGGIEVVRRLSGKIDAIMLESVFTNYNFTLKKYVPETQPDRLRLAKSARKELGIPILILEYAEAQSEVERAEKLARENGFPVYVSTIDLLNLPRTPKLKSYSLFQ